MTVSWPRTTSSWSGASIQAMMGYGQGRARSERWGTNPLLGGGSTIRREEGRLEYARLRGQLAERTREVEQDAELRAGVAEAVRLYREGRGAADAGL